VQAIQGCDAVVYGMGSLYTSICPTLILEGVGEAIAARHDVLKVQTGMAVCVVRIVYAAFTRLLNLADTHDDDWR
jgi:2-phospho-L-lactate transferase/gluconeogenesis factor (CofD/UPF0052 family)